MSMKKIAFLLPLILLSSCHVGRFFIWNTADVKDYKKFAARTIEKPIEPFRFVEAIGTDALKLPKEITIKNQSYTFEQALEKSGTLAYLVIRNDSILYERYFDKYDAASIVPSFSVAKSFVSALVGIAIDEGCIKSVHDPITLYLNNLDGVKFGAITIEHLLNMRSGIQFNEGYFNPFGDVAKYYYGKNLKNYVARQDIRQAPDQAFEYISVNTQLLAMIVEQATGRPLDALLQEKIWQPLGMEYDATWSIDSRKNGTIKAFCCLNARARDFAKFGRLYLNNGTWNGQQIISEDWVRRSTVMNSEVNNFIYMYQWWHTVDTQPLADSTYVNGLHRINNNADGTKYLVQPAPDYYAEGILGQFIYLYPDKNIIIVRLGKKEGPLPWATLAKAIARNN